ncbi:hypothetical protein EYC84_002506 [Monilinia fructicola]|uniref:Uncharacterized protein n=1 Tax=Monilinia fructicola TaxID=38448 RepID=A0A5M9JQW3_MONFR|nr:hypothetical protein EYC84_002506 [Monilinia fructicola]
MELLIKPILNCICAKLNEQYRAYAVFAARSSRRSSSPTQRNVQTTTMTRRSPFFIITPLVGLVPPKFKLIVPSTRNRPRTAM